MKTPPAINTTPRLKSAFIGPFAIVLAFVMCAFALSTYLMGIRVRNLDLAERSAAVVRLFEQKLDKDTNLMRAVLRSIMANPALAEAFQNRDRAALEHEAGSLFEALRAEHAITHLYFNDVTLVNVLRLHSPGEFGDVINRMTMLTARERGRTVHGLELGPLGTLTLRLVSPWRIGNGIAGYLEIGEEIQHLIEEIRDSLSVELLVLIDKRFLSHHQWTRGQDLLQRHGDWDLYSSRVAVAQTAVHVPEALNEQLLDRLHGSVVAEIDDGGRALHLGMLPLTDAAGQRIGDLVVMRDITALQTTIRWTIAAAALLSILAGGAVMRVFFVSLGRIERDYRRQQELERQIMRMDTEHQRIVQVEKLSALGTMVAGIAHQLNNPLVGVVNMAQLADREADDPVRTRELLADIRRAGEDCRTFMRRMLEFSKVTGFEPKATPMAPLIDDTIQLFRQAERRPIAVDVRLPDAPVVLSVDAILIRHALFNLLLNACQATTGNGAIVVALEPRADPGSGSPGWAICVSDHGRGIAPEVMNDIFVPFFTTRSDGTGLGLPVVQHVALLHNGYVTASNVPDGGARFEIWLPENG